MAAINAFKSIPSLIFFTFTTFTITTITASPKRLVIELIHRDSIRSPFHNHKQNLTIKAQHAIRTSLARFAYLQSKIKSSSSTSEEDYEADVFPSVNSSLFYMNFSIGRPPIPQFTVMDTGSSLLWIQCQPCPNCSKQFGPIFNPSKSSTFNNLPCTSPFCRFSPGAKNCNNNNFYNRCRYNQTYVNGPSSSGVLATEEIVFKTSDEGTTFVPEVIFGCGHDNGNLLSLVSQLGHSFSYCIGNLYDPFFYHNKLILGQVINGRYYITLKSISVGEKQLDLDPNIFKRKRWSNDGVIIDTGSPATWLVKEGFEALRDEVQGLLDMWLTRYWYNSWTLCYEGAASRDLVGFPVVRFEFEDGAELVLDRKSLFLQAWPNAFCMAVFPSFVNGDDYTRLSLIGMMAQQNYNVAYDIGGRRLSFERIDCELLDD
ncbi:hypothetical protein Pint_14300 [Pistacia integerrima]|uniref:Uncharacterized protein n=1 Tax=Pistacia integerrima TaxID=434235 RepID=A0ACC0Y6A0_9ROSI|nr:hypothetical protein Pint_14300 [Pistacia integerrima]